MKLKCVTFFILYMAAGMNSVLAMDLKCTAQHRLIHGNRITKAAYQFYLLKKRGVIKIDGVYKDERATWQISREIKVSYSANQHILKVRNIGMLIYPMENIPKDVLKTDFPLFFTTEGESLTFIVNEVGKKSWALTYNTLPLFLCSKMK